MKFKRIHKDQRGRISSLTGKDLGVPEITIFHTNARYARGGCIHRKNSEHLCVIKGMISYYYRLPGRSIVEVISIRQGGTISIKPNTAHYFIAVTDCIVMEWGPEISEKEEKDKVFRNLVLKHNANL